MIILDSTTRTLEISLSGAPATTQLPFVLSFVELLDSTQEVNDVGSANGVTISATPVTMVAAPATGYTRQIKTIHVPNVDTTGAQVTINFNDGGTLRRLVQVVLDTGDNLYYHD